jgi:starvation-inducible DNA-binding protein
MPVTHRQSPFDPPDLTVADVTLDKASPLLEELLWLTIAVRDMYSSARYQGADIGIRHLRPLFDTHYMEQLRLVDLLADRICALHGTQGCNAPDPQGTRSTYLWRSVVPERLLRDLLDAHVSVLSAADTAGANSLHTVISADTDFAIGRVVLTNDLQSHSVREQLVGLQM